MYSVLYFTANPKTKVQHVQKGCAKVKPRQNQTCIMYCILQHILTSDQDKHNKSDGNYKAKSTLRKQRAHPRGPADPKKINFVL